MFHEGPGKVHPVDGRQAQAPRGAQPWRSNGPRRLSCAYVMRAACCAPEGSDMIQIGVRAVPGDREEDTRRRRWRGGHARSHAEHGSEAPPRR